MTPEGVETVPGLSGVPVGRFRGGVIAPLPGAR